MSVKTRLSLAAIVATTVFASHASAAVVAGWTINTAFPVGTGNVPTGTSYLPPNPAGAGLAETGANITGSQLRSVHALAAATYTSPAGNGSQYSFSSNNWSPGDYYEVRVSTSGFANISVSWDSCRSSTGPAAFKLMMSVDGGLNFSQVMTYTVQQSGGGSAPGTWATGTPRQSLYTNSTTVDAAAANLALVIFRFQNAESAVSQAAGSNRVDNVFINGDAVPTPGALALLGVAGLAAGRRRR